MFQGQKVMLFYKCFRSLNSTLKGLGLVLNITSDSFHKHILEDGGWGNFVGKYCFPFVKFYSKLFFEYVYWRLRSLNTQKLSRIREDSTSLCLIVLTDLSSRFTSNCSFFPFIISGSKISCSNKLHILITCQMRKYLLLLTLNRL